MNRFAYVRPTTVAEAVLAGAAPGSAYLAGGTNLLDLMKGGIARPERLIDISRLSGLDRIEALEDGGMRIGALVKNSDLAYDPTFSKRYPAVAEALLSGASAQLRNAATVAGNVLQRTRCSYFYDPASGCNKREPGSGCDALGGENHLHAVLGWSQHCIATNPSDFCVPLTALNAVVEIEGPTGRREVAVESFHRLPGDEPQRDTVLNSGELVTAVRLPAEAATFAASSRYLKVRERNFLRVRRGLGRCGIEARWLHHRRSAFGPRRSRPQALAGTRGRAVAGRQAVRRRRVFRRGGGRSRGCEAIRSQSLQDRACAPGGRSRSDARRARHARSHARPSRLPVRTVRRTCPPCLRPLPFISVKALTSASL